MMTTIRSFPLSLAPALGGLLLCACPGPEEAASGDDSTGGQGTSTGSDVSMSSEPTTTATATATESETATTTTTTGETDGGSESGSETTGDTPLACVDLVPRVVGILEANCAKCHGADSAAQGGINYILELDELVLQNKVVPGAPEQSRIYIRMTAAENPMPPIAEPQRPTEGDIEAVRQWIAECAGVQSCSDAQQIPTEQVLATVAQDLAGVGDPQFTRYISFVHLANAGFCDPEIELYRHALSKLVNSLSQKVNIVAPVAIDAQKLIYRVDLRDYAWEGQVALSAPTFYFSDGDDDTLNDAEKLELAKLFADKWDMIADQSPYSVRYLGDQADLLSELTATKFPILQGDAFIDVTTRAPLYYDILGIPTRSGQLSASAPPCMGDACLETKLGLDILGNVADETAQDADVVSRAGFKKSDVSDFNRVIERHAFPLGNNGSMWLTYDFAGQSGNQNLLVHPLDFASDLNAILFTLPNGFHGYMVADAEGNRLDEAPPNIIRDPSQKDSLVRSAVSCMGCHSQGLIKAQDDVRFLLDQNMLPEQFTDQEKDDIRDLYPQRDDFAALQQQDIELYRLALELSGVPEDANEPVLASFLAFDENVSLRRVAAEFGLTVNELLQVFEKLGKDLGDLSEGNTIQRNDFTRNFGESICALGLGLTRCCPVAPEILDPSCG